jgi:hypothetical protein
MAEKRTANLNPFLFSSRAARRVLAVLGGCVLGLRRGKLLFGRHIFLDDQKNVEI